MRFPQARHHRGKGGRRADIGDMYFRSTWEANYARYLNWLVGCGQIEAWLYEPDTFEFVGIKRGSRFYTPDFKVTNRDGTVEYHEVKGYLDQRGATKLKRMKRYHPKVKLIVIDKEQYRAIHAQIGSGLPGWEGRKKWNDWR